MKAGKYIIVKDSFWSIEGAKVLVITSVDETAEEFCYFYENSLEKETTIRYRSFADFECIELIPASSLALELI